MQHKQIQYKHVHSSEINPSCQKRLKFLSPETPGSSASRVTADAEQKHHTHLEKLKESWFPQYVCTQFEIIFVSSQTASFTLQCESETVLTMRTQFHVRILISCSFRLILFDLPLLDFTRKLITAPSSSSFSKGDYLLLKTKKYQSLNDPQSIHIHDGFG